MEINKPLHGQVHLWIIFSIIISGYLAIILNKLYVKHHPDSIVGKLLDIQMAGIGEDT